MLANSKYPENQVQSFLKKETFSFSDLTSIIMIVSFLSFPRTYAEIKFIFICLFIFSHIPKIFSSENKLFDPLVLIFYSVVSGFGLVATIVGINNNGDSDGIIDGFRLYVAWSLAFTIIITLLLSNANVFRVLNVSIVISGILISVINAFALYGARFGLNIFPDSFMIEMDLRVGFHDGYVQMVSQNIGSLFFIIPYLICSFIRFDRVKSLSVLTAVALILCLVLAIFSGRRALWIVVVLTPWVSIVMSYLNGTSDLNKKQSAIMVGSVLGAFLLLFYLFSNSGLATWDFLMSAFSAEDERTIQRSYLIDGFFKWPVLGSGFGVSADYIRNIDAPWLYELSYFQLLFNFGLVGCVFFVVTGASYFRMALQLSAYRDPGFNGSFALLVGLAGFIAGSYSNPYFSSFDFLFLLAILPLIASLSVRAKVA